MGLPAELSVGTRVLEPGITAVTVLGSVDPYNALGLRHRMIEEIDNGGAGHLVLELAGLEYLDSTGLGVLVGLHKRLRRQGGSLYVVGMTERVGKILRITGLRAVLLTADSAAEAIERIRAPGPEERCAPRHDEPG